jgi:hypothetical protein
MAGAPEQDQNQVIYYQDHRMVNEFDGVQNPEIIGEGGFGTVISAQHKIDRKCYAIKKIRINGSHLNLP